jgi:hypothetical protein
MIYGWYILNCHKIAHKLIYKSCCLDNIKYIQTKLNKGANFISITSPYVYRRVVLIPWNQRKIQYSRTKSVLFSPWSVICAHGYKYSLMFETMGLKISQDMDFEYKRKFFI